jgi:hypothetical protein
MPGNRTLSRVFGAALVGAVAAVALVWLNRPESPSCVTWDNGMLACLPIYVVDVPLWLYGAVAIIGALLAGALAYACSALLRQRLARG